jgi:hypothetical protein
MMMPRSKVFVLLWNEEHIMDKRDEYWSMIKLKENAYATLAINEKFYCVTQEQYARGGSRVYHLMIGSTQRM